MLVGSSKAMLSEFSSCLRFTVGARRGLKSRNLTVVSLTTDVPGLGLQSDQVVVKAGRMRNELFPNGLALYTNNRGRVIPNTPFGSIILPQEVLRANVEELARKHGQTVEDMERKSSAKRTVAAETVAKDQIDPSLAQPRRTAEQSDAAQQAAKAREETLTADLRSLSVLSFQRKAKTADGELFGSVTIDEVIRKLRADHDIILESASFATGDRVKQKGLHTVFVRLPITQTEVTFTIDVKAS